LASGGAQAIVEIAEELLGSSKKRLKGGMKACIAWMDGWMDGLIDCLLACLLD